MDIITNVTFVVLLAALLLPALSRFLTRHYPKLDRPMRYFVFGVYVLANLYETLLFRAVMPNRKMLLELLWSYRAAIRIKHHFSITNFRLLQEIILNVLLYIPLGYLIPFTWPKFFEKGRRLPWLVILIGFGCSVLTEVTQLIFKIGWFEFDDMLNNTAGTVIGAFIYMAWMRKRMKSRHITRQIYL